MWRPIDVWNPHYFNTSSCELEGFKLIIACRITLYNITTSAKGGAIGLTRSTGLGAVALGLAVVVMVFL